MADLQAVIDGILAGDYDGQHADLIDACRKRVASGATSMRWRLRFGDYVWDEDSVTVGEMRFVEQTTAKKWNDIETPVASASNLATFIVAHLHKIEGMTLADAIAQVDGLTAKEALDLASEYEVVKPDPKDGSTASTNS